MSQYWLEIGEADALYRGMHYPKAFRTEKGRDKYRVCDPSRGLFLQYEASTHTLETSVVWEQLAPFDCEIHGYGCRLSKRRNVVAPPDIYCGAYQMTLARLRAKCLVANLAEVTQVDARHDIENDGEIAHANLRFRLDPKNPSASDLGAIEDVKQVIEDRVWNVLRGPLRHVCPADADDIAHPSEKLSIPPEGIYVDDRGIFARFVALFVYIFWRQYLFVKGRVAGRRFYG